MPYKEMSLPPKNYRPETVPTNRYQKAKQENEDRYGAARVQAANWRIFALVAVFANIILACGLIIQSTKSTIIPYMVRVNANGSAQAAGRITGEYAPGEKEIKYFLSQFVQKVRTIPTDPVVFKQNWLSAYAFLRQPAAVKMNGVVTRENPTAQIGTETHEVEIVSILPVSQNTYQVRWKETVYDKGGNQTEQANMSGMFTISFTMPRDEKTLLVNPLGIYIADFNWGKEND